MAKLQKLEKLKDRAEKKSVNRAETRDELAAHAVQTLAQLGYARTGLRDIAQQSGRSVGSLTYYFDDKNDLICHCVRLYKEKFIAEIDVAIRRGRMQGSVIEAVAKAFASAVADDAETHRLWYDIRSQSLFESQFREVVGEIETNLTLLISRVLDGVGMPTRDVTPAYFMLDGAFRIALQEHLEGQAGAAAKLEAQVMSVLSQD